MGARGAGGGEHSRPAAVRAGAVVSPAAVSKGRQAWCVTCPRSSGARRGGRAGRGGLTIEIALAAGVAPKRHAALPAVQRHGLPRVAQRTDHLLHLFPVQLVPLVGVLQAAGRAAGRTREALLRLQGRALRESAPWRVRGGRRVRSAGGRRAAHLLPIVLGCVVTVAAPEHLAAAGGHQLAAAPVVGAPCGRWRGDAG